MKNFRDVDSGPSDAVSSQDNFFFVPVVMVKEHLEKWIWPVSYGLTLEPIQNVKGRFRRIGYFEVEDVASWLVWKRFGRYIGEPRYRILPHLIAQASKFWVRNGGFDKSLRKTFMTQTLERSNYQDFDGVSRYTIEIV